MTLAFCCLVRGKMNKMWKKKDGFWMKKTIKIDQLPALFQPARPVLAKIEQAGFEAYFVGGCVRDTILHGTIHDIDIATSAYPSEIKQIFHKTVDTGIEHGTVMILDHGTGYETTTFRTESGYQDFRRPDKVTFVRSLADDLKRRDFTINALAMKEDGTVIDLFDGLGDLKRHLIRAVGDPQARFHEDALRMMRAVRFASKLDFAIDQNTLAGIKDHAQLLKKITIERIQVEFEKLLLGQNPSRGLKDLVDTGLYAYCPGLKDQKAVLQGLSNSDRWQLKEAASAWAVLTWPMHLATNQQSKFLKSWKLSNQLIKDVAAINHFLDDLAGDKVDNRSLFACGQQRLLAAIDAAQVLGIPVDSSKLLQQYRDLPLKDRHQLAIDGGTILKTTGIKPGPRLGQIIAQLTDAVIMGQVANQTADLKQAAQELAKGGK